MLQFVLAKITSCKEMDFSVVSIFVCLIAAYNCVPANGQQKCADKFLELDVIKYRAVNTSRIGYTLDGQTRFLTEYQFNCSSTNITSVILGIDVRLPTNSRTMFPSIQLYRPGTGNIGQSGYGVVDERVIYYTSSNVSTSGVYEYPLDPPIKANNGDVLAVHQPPSQMSIVRVSYIQNITFKSHIVNNFALEGRDRRNQQLILVYPVTDNYCINSFNLITDSIIRQNSLKIYNSSDIDGMPTQYFYPDISFSCNGTITKWIFGGTEQNGSRSPELQIWRQTDANNYVKIESSLINISTPIFNYTNVYEFKPQPPLMFQEGDMLGIYVPNKAESQLILKEQTLSGPVNLILHYVNGPQSALNITDDFSMQESGNDFPLITAEISIDTPSITYTTVITTTVASQDIVPIDQTNTDTMMIQASSTVKFTSSFSIEFASSIHITSNTMFLTEGTLLTTPTSSEPSEVLSTSSLSISPIISSSAPPSLLVPIITSSVLIIIMIAVIILVIVIAVVIIYRRHSGTKTLSMTNTLNEEIVLFPNPTYGSSHITDRVEEPAGRAAVSSYENLPLSHTSQPKYIVPDYHEVSRDEHERATVRNVTVENALYEEIK